MRVEKAFSNGIVHVSLLLIELQLQGWKTGYSDFLSFCIEAVSLNCIKIEFIDLCMTLRFGVFINRLVLFPIQLNWSSKFF